jgi:hypothetical protein
MRSKMRAAGLSAAALVLFALLPAVAGAHETREVADGQYRLVVGFLNEPVAVGDKSGLDLRVTTPATDGSSEPVPVEGLEGTLQGEVYYGEESMALAIEPRFGQPGAYASYFYPNAAGTYSFRVFGEIEGVAVDETFTSGPDTFGDVQERLLFPAGEAAAAGPAVTSAGLGDLPVAPADGMAVAAVVAAAIWFGRREQTRRRSTMRRSS